MFGGVAPRSDEDEDRQPHQREHDDRRPHRVIPHEVDDPADDCDHDPHREEGAAAEAGGLVVLLGHQVPEPLGGTSSSSRSSIHPFATAEWIASVMLEAIWSPLRPHPKNLRSWIVTSSGVAKPAS